MFSEVWEIVSAWPTLSLELRAAILAIVASTKWAYHLRGSLITATDEEFADDLETLRSYRMWTPLPDTQLPPAQLTH